MDAATIELLHFQRTALQKLQALLQIEAGAGSPAQPMVSYARVKSRIHVLAILSEFGPLQQPDAVSIVARLVKVCAVNYGVPEANQTITISTNQFTQTVTRAFALTFGFLIVECVCALLEGYPGAPPNQTQLRIEPDGPSRIAISAISSDVEPDKREFPTAIARLLAEEVGANLDVAWGRESAIGISIAANG